MNLAKIKKLVLIDLLQSNRQMNTSGKKLDQKNIIFRMLLQNGIILVSFSVLYASLLSQTPFLYFPGLFTNMLNTILLFSSLQFFQFIFSLFYGDEDLSAYLSLPFTVKELFFSKLTSLLLSSFSFFVFPILLFSILGAQANLALIIAIPLAILFTLLIYSVLLLSIFAFLHLLNQLEIFKKHKRVFSIGIYVLLTITVFYLLFKQSYSTPEPSMGMELVDQKINPLFIGFYEIFIPELFLSGLWKVIVWVAILLGLLIFMDTKIIPELFGYTHTHSKAKKVKNKSNTYTYKNSRFRNFLTYQLRQLQDTTFIMQLIFSKFYIPFVMLAPFLFGGSDVGDFSGLNEMKSLWGLFIIAGFVSSTLLIDSSSISGVAISLDQENYYYIQSMPFSFRKYLKTKFYFSFFIEWFLGGLAILAITLVLKFSILFTLSTLLGYTLGTYLMSLHYFKKDYKNLYLHWKNFTELAKRGMNQAIRIFILMILVMIFGVGLFFVFMYFITTLPTSVQFAISILLTILLPAVTFIYSKRQENIFWEQFN